MYDNPIQKGRENEQAKIHILKPLHKNNFPTKNVNKILPSTSKKNDDCDIDTTPKSSKIKQYKIYGDESVQKEKQFQPKTDETSPSSDSDEVFI